ncbi:outer membrane lipoprotein chaperone LolA [Gilvimarinus sp. F26214L]|uniref:outer membrane lipoprotein chaperone LolA n=1 Tax=Gilvimarinus sp. DZF01 TaxID=3461371 RepID=UPI0040466BE5
MHIKPAILVLNLALLAVPTMAANDDPLLELHQLLSQTRSLQGDFSQVTTDQDGEIVEENTGTFAIKRPGLLRWHIAQPFEQLLVSDGESLWVYDPDLEQVTINTVDEQMQENSALLLSSDLEKLKANYRVEDVRRNNGTTVYALVPLDSGNAFEKLELEFKGQQPVGWELYTALGEQSTFSFEDLKVNQDIPGDLFRFEPPEGVDVLDER